jgi:hypothetical protein
LIRGLGYKADRRTNDELVFSTGRLGATFDTASLRWARRGVLDQGPANACVGFAFARALHMGLVLAGEQAPPLPSPRWIYWAARRLEHEGPPERAPPLVDEGSYPRLAAKALQTLGFCPSPSWPYNAAQVNEPPGFRAFEDAYDQRALECLRIEGTGAERVRRVAAAIRAGYTPVFGMDVDDAFMVHDGPSVIDTIDPSRIVGGHMVAALDVTADGVGFDNSWGPNWGVAGTGTLSWEFFGSEHVHDVYALSVAPLRRKGQLA